MHGHKSTHKSDTFAPDDIAYLDGPIQQDRGTHEHGAERREAVGADACSEQVPPVCERLVLHGALHRTEAER